MRQRILLTGVSGQVGGELWQSLSCLGDVVATVGPADAHWPQTTVMNLADETSIRAVIRDVEPTLIVNPAAYTAVDKAETDLAMAMAINAEAPAVIAEEARRLGAALIHFSTDYVYRGDGDEPFDESAEPGPINAYGKSKLAGDEAILRSGVAHVILRTSWVYGVNGRNFVKTMIKLGKTRDELRVIADQFGAPTAARTLADVTQALIASCGSDIAGVFGKNGGVLHVANAGGTSWHGFAEEILRLAAENGIALQASRVIPIATEDYPTPASRPKNSRLSCTALRERFGILTPSWQQALRHSFPAIAHDV